MSEELKPCPFCGGDAECNENKSHHYGFDVPAVTCTNCGVRNFCSSKEEAVRDWNARHTTEVIGNINESI